MKKLLFLLAVLVVAAPTFAVDLTARATSGGFIVGTLADAHNPVDLALAPEYNRLAVVRTRTANRIRALATAPARDTQAVQTALEAAVRIQRSADEARSALDDLARHTTADAEFQAALSVARDAILRAETLYDFYLSN